MRKADFDKRTTLAIKGIALILMFAHHFFAYPEWYVEGVAYPQLSGHLRFFRYSLKICVPAFAFLTGYFYAYANRRTLSYSLRKMTDILVSYWVVFVPALCFALATGYRSLSVFGLLMGILGRNISLMTFCWYVSFYCAAMLLLPLLSSKEEKAPIREILVMVLLPVAVCAVTESLIGSDTLGTMLEEIRLWFPGVAAGYLCCKYRIFGRIEGAIRKAPAGMRVLLYLACICAAMAGRSAIESVPLFSLRVLGEDVQVRCTMDVFYAPMFVYGISMLLRRAGDGYVMSVLRRIGEQSLLMWFIHCIFFNVSNEITQRILYWPRHPVLVVGFGLLMCYAAALVISPVQSSMIRLKNRMLGGFLKG